MIFEVEENGELSEIVDSSFEPLDESVYIFISTYDKRCYLWFGSDSGVRKQFIAANEGRKIKMDTAFSTCNVQHEGEEKAFKKAFSQWKKDIKNDVPPAAVAIEQRQRIQEMNEEGEVNFTPPVRKGRKKSRKKKSKSNAGTKKKATTDVSKMDITIKTIPKGSQIQIILEKLATLEPVEGHVRDYIVTSGYVFSTTLNEDNIEVEVMDKIKDGVFFVENYRNRYYLEGSNLIAVEMWRIPK